MSARAPAIGPADAGPPSGRSGWCAARATGCRRTAPGWPGSSGCCSTASRRAGYEPMRTPVLEFTELHERKSGAGIVSKLFELAGAGPGGHLPPPRADGRDRPRVHRGAASAPPCPGGSASSGPVFRYETTRAATGSASSPRSASSCSAPAGRLPTPR